MIAVCRMSRDKQTRAYVAKCTAGNKSKKGIICCLMRYIARGIYKIRAAASSQRPSISGP